VYPNLAIKEFSRILRKGGQLIITAPFCSMTHMAPYHYSTGFNQFWYKDVLEKFGFCIKEQMRNGSYFEYLAQEVRRLPIMASKYSGCNIEESENEIIDAFLYLMEKMHISDSGSSEMMCFGYQIVAIKE